MVYVSGGRGLRAGSDETRKGTRMRRSKSPVRRSGMQKVSMTQGKAIATVRGEAGTMEEPTIRGMRYTVSAMQISTLRSRTNKCKVAGMEPVYVLEGVHSPAAHADWAATLAPMPEPQQVCALSNLAARRGAD